MNANFTKKLHTMSAALAAATATFAAPDVSNVTMTQNDGNRQVTINYELSEDAVVTLDILTNSTANAATGWTSIGGEHICNAKGDVWKKVVAAGTHTITWQPTESWFDGNGDGFKVEDGCAKAVVSAWPLDNTPDYMVVDISAVAQPNTQRYYPRVDFLPGSELGQKGAVTNNPAYKTSMLVMRKIMAKDITWTMGSTAAETQRNATREATHQVTLTNNFYIGVYEVTQSQWSQVATNSTISANYTTEGFMRPMEKVCYNEIRNAANSNTEKASYNWPADPNPSSFLGLLRSKTGLDFDLPSEAQWEFAARAGNGVGYWNDGSAILNANPDANLNLLGRYERNGGKVPSGTSYVDAAATCGVTNGTAIVGSYAPNAWGLYDMHGNVMEWCLDWHEDNISTYGGAVNIDPENPAKTLSGASVANREIRGGGWSAPAGNCRPAYRDILTPNWRHSLIGFRVICTAGLK